MGILCSKLTLCLPLAYLSTIYKLFSLLTPLASHLEQWLNSKDSILEQLKTLVINCIFFYRTRFTWTGARCCRTSPSVPQCPSLRSSCRPRPWRLKIFSHFKRFSEFPPPSPLPSKATFWRTNFLAKSFYKVLYVELMFVVFLLIFILWGWCLWFRGWGFCTEGIFCDTMKYIRIQITATAQYVAIHNSWDRDNPWMFIVDSICFSLLLIVAQRLQTNKICCFFLDNYFPWNFYWEIFSCITQAYSL